MSQFAQDMSQIPKDSQFITKIMSDNKDGMYDVDINKLVTEREFQMIDRFYENCTIFNKDESLEMLNILAKLMFRQEKDFALLTAIKFKLGHKAYDFTYFFEDLTREVNGQILYRAGNELEISAKYGAILTFDLLVTLTNQIYENFYYIAYIAGKYGQLEFLKHIYQFALNHNFEYANLDMNCIYLKEIQQNCKNWIHSLDILDSNSYRDSFIYACEDEKLLKIKWLYNPRLITDPLLHRTFISECKSGKLNVIRLLMELAKIPKRILGKAIKNITNYEVIDFFYDNGFVDNEIANDHFENSCSNSLELVKYVYAKGLVTSEGLSMGFAKCFPENFETAKWIISLNPKLEEEDIVHAFMSICEANNIEMAEWLKSNVLLNYDSFATGFLSACENGNVDIAKWILSNEELKNEEMKEGFDLACEKSKIKIITWLWDEMDITDDDIKQGFLSGCNNGNLEAVKLFYAARNIEEETFEEGFNDVIETGNFSLIKWFIESGRLDEDYIQEKVEDNEDDIIVSKIFTKLGLRDDYNRHLEDHEKGNLIFGAENLNEISIEILIENNLISQEKLAEIFQKAYSENDLVVIELIYKEGNLSADVIDDILEKSLADGNQEIVNILTE